MKICAFGRGGPFSSMHFFEQRRFIGVLVGSNSPFAFTLAVNADTVEDICCFDVLRL
jgi:hypothetical protein